MAKAICIEGIRNVGKSFLIKNLDNKTVYKYPFANYFENCYIHDHNINIDVLNSRIDLAYLTMGYNTAVLELLKQNIIKDDIIIDRNFLSALVFNIQSGRITYEQAVNQYNYIFNQYADQFKIIWVTADIKQDNRNKDRWDIYNPNNTLLLYEKLIKDLNIPIIEFRNNFDEDSVIRFKELIEKI